MAARRPRPALLRLGAPLRSAHAVRGARALPLALPGDACTGAYDAEIAYTDAQVGRLLDALEPTAASTDTLVVVVGDHGEMLGEHGEQTHGFFIYEAATHIPLIVAGPGRARARRSPTRCAWWT